MITNHPLQHGPVERFAGHHGLAVNADGLPAGRALPEEVDRIGLRLDDTGYSQADLGNQSRRGHGLCELDRQERR